MNGHVPLFCRCLCHHDFSVHTGPDKLHRDVIGVGLVDAKTDGRAILTVLQPVFDDITDQFGAAHDFRYLVFVVVISERRQVAGFNASHIGFRWGKKFVLAQVADADQLFHGRGFDKALEILPHPRCKRCTG
ncbi:hypothetical protein D3C86_1585340 [compost metagenome]